MTDTSPDTTISADVLFDTIKMARQYGADQVDILVKITEEISVNSRLLKVENITRAHAVSIGMRVFVEKKSAVISTNNVQDLRNASFLEKAIFAAGNSPEESEKSRADEVDLCTNFRKIDLCDPVSPSHERLVEDALKCEDVALQIDGVANSEGASASHSRTKTMLAKSDNYFGDYEKTINQISMVAIAQKNGCMESDAEYSSAVYYADMKTPEYIAQRAAEKAIQRCGARKIASCSVPVIFHRDVASQLLDDLVGALNGAAIANGTSFLKDKLCRKIFGDTISIVDRYALDRGLRSRPFDADGLECVDNNIVEMGVLNSFLLDVKYANRLGRKSTGNASGWGTIAPRNICIKNGDVSLPDMISGVKNGLYVTDVIGQGLNIVTGNFSQGAVGFWIVDGEIAYPVNEITVAQNFIDMFAHCRVASDLEIKCGIDAPSILMKEMIVGGI
jgi:PmbA protein